MNHNQVPIFCGGCQRKVAKLTLSEDGPPEFRWAGRAVLPETGIERPRLMRCRGTHGGRCGRRFRINAQVVSALADRARNRTDPKREPVYI